MRVEPEHAPGATHTGKAAERSERDRVVASEDERQVPALDGTCHELSDPLAGLLDLRQEARVLIADRACLGNGGHDVAPVLAAPPELRDLRVEARVPNRRGPHVDAPPAGTEIERRADDRNRLRRLPTHEARLTRSLPGERPLAQIGVSLRMRLVVARLRASGGGLRPTRWRGPESNRRHHGFQPCALPTELPRRGRLV